MKVIQIVSCMLASTLTLHAGCDPGDPDDEVAGELEFRPIGGVWLNTSSIGSLMFSALDLDGKVLDGLTLTDVLVARPNNEWLRMDTIDIASGQIRGKRDTVQYMGADLVGSRWLLTPVQGAPTQMWISGYTEGPGGEMRYTFQTLDADGAPVHVCDADSQGDHSALAIKDITVDHETGVVAARKKTLYLACVSGAVGKARMWGYGTTSLAGFEAAVRMVRADYCYDGISWTTDGTGVQVRDLLNINGFLHPEYATEAVWTLNGLGCLTQPRRTIYTGADVTCGGAAVPSCPPDLTMTTYPGTVFWTKIGAVMP